jgi:hypothetical protein
MTFMSSRKVSRKISDATHAVKVTAVLVSRKQKMKTAFFWVITQRVVVIPYRRLGTTCCPILKVQESKNHAQGRRFHTKVMLTGCTSIERQMKFQLGDFHGSVSQ